MGSINVLFHFRAVAAIHILPDTLATLNLQDVQ